MSKPDFPKLIDSTMLTSWDSCAAKFHAEHILCLSPMAINPHLHAGGAYAKALEVIYGSYHAEGKTFKEAFDLGVRAMTIFWGDYEPPEGVTKTYPAMVGALVSYFEEYPIASDPYKPLMKEDGTPAVEFSFSIPMLVPHPQTGDPILFGGRCDMLFDFEGSFIGIKDDKTTKNMSYNAPMLWAMRGQFIGYCYAGQQYGYDTSRALVRIIAILKTKYNHMQLLEEYPQWQIDRWWKVANIKVARMVDNWNNDEWIQSYGDACSSYGGCVFLKPETDLCLTEQPERMYGQFEKRTWDPLKKDPTWPVGGPKYETVGTLDDMVKGLET